jgi:undecaprenyl-diphosphatase
VVERSAIRVARRGLGPAWTVVVVAVVGFVCLTLSMVVVGGLVTHLGLLGGLRHWDEHVNRSFAGRRTDRWTRVSAFASGSAETLPIVVGGLLVEAVLALLRRWRDLLLTAVALLLEITVFLAVNEAVRRPRPSVPRLGSLPRTFSFPSGHIAATVVLYGCVAMLLSLQFRSRVVSFVSWLIVALAAIAVGTARVYRGMHHVTDVVAGAAMGSACLLIAAIATRSSSLAARSPSPSSEPLSHRS